MNQFKKIYLCAYLEKLKFDLPVNKEIAKHYISKQDGVEYFWPHKVNANSVNPKNFIELKEKFNIDEMLFVDRLKGTNNILTIIDHVNRSGQNFLRSVTPEDKFPQFPDMSKIYNKVSGLNYATVHTLGSDRFANPPHEKDIIWSEFIGLVAPVFHYVGVKVSAIGCKDINKIIKMM